MDHPNIIVAIGANLPGPDGAPAIETCRRAAAALAELPGFQRIALSRWYRTRPVPASDQPDYVNGVALIRATAAGADQPPETILARLQEIEAGFGRVRGVRNAARTLDLDIIGIGDLIRAAPDPVIPHPRAHERAFVLAPLVDVWPDWVHPVLGRTAREMLAALGAAGGEPVAL